MKLYSLTKSEVSIIETLNTQRRNVLLIVCDFGDDGIGVDPDALQEPKYSDYLVEALDDTFDAGRVVEFEVVGDAQAMEGQ